MEREFVVVRTYQEAPPSNRSIGAKHSFSIAV
jgi:hypothetical protein